MVVSNHESNADPFLVSFLPWEMKWLGKASLFRIPVVGWMMRMAGDIPVERGDSDSAKAAMAVCGRWLERGDAGDALPRGHAGARTGSCSPSRTARSGSPSRPERTCCRWPSPERRAALPKHSWKFGRSDGRVTVGTPISTAGMTLADVEGLKARARAEIEALPGAARRAAALT